MVINLFLRTLETPILTTAKMVKFAGPGPSTPYPRAPTTSAGVTGDDGQGEAVSPPEYVPTPMTAPPAPVVPAPTGASAPASTPLERSPVSSTSTSASQLLDGFRDSPQQVSPSLQLDDLNLYGPGEATMEVIRSVEEQMRIEVEPKMMRNK